jgi:hypothetical protein
MGREACDGARLAGHDGLALNVRDEVVGSAPPRARSHSKVSTGLTVTPFSLSSNARAISAKG